MKVSSSPCLLGEQDADINPDYTRLESPSGCLDFSLSNTILYCEHWQETRDFYQHTLGLKPRFSKDDWFIELQVNDGAHLSIADASRCSIAPGQGVGLTLSLKTPDLTALHRYLREKGLKPGPMVDKSWREPFFYVHDPEGNRIEFWTARSELP